MSEQGTTVTVGTKSLDAMWAEIDQQAYVETPPPGARIVADLAEKWGLSRQAAESRAKAFVRQGVLTAKTYRIHDCNGHVREITHYLPATTKPARRAKP